MRTRNKNLNAMVESAWQQWSKAVQLRRKLWCMTHAKVQDGEAFGLLRNNPRLRAPVDLDIILIETEQVTSPRIIPYTAGYIDGIRYDQFGNPISYDVLKHHPGGQFAWSGTEFEQIPAKWMLHWFMMRRPGQHRGVPEFRSTLNVGASSRRWREATLAAAETAADYAAIIHTNLTPDGADEADDDRPPNGVGCQPDEIGTPWDDLRSVSRGPSQRDGSTQVDPPESRDVQLLGVQLRLGEARPRHVLPDNRLGAVGL
jgi:capsid protein